MMENIEVNMGDLVVSKGPENLTTSAVGSCLVIALYDSKHKVGGLAHAMLPTRRASNPIPNTQYERRETKHVDVAIDQMLKRIEANGAKREDLEAKIIGGANMFPALKSDIGKENVLAAKKKLKKEGVRLVGESVGGSQGRSVEFSVASGIVTVKIKF